MVIYGQWYLMLMSSKGHWVLHPTGYAPISLPLLRPPYSLRHNIEIRSINNPMIVFKCLSEGRSHMSSTLNQKPEIQLSLVKKLCQKPSWLKARPLRPNSSQVLNAKEKFSKGDWMCYSSELMDDKKMKSSYCWYGESFSGLDGISNQSQHSLKIKLNSKQGPKFQLYKNRERWESWRRKVCRWQRLVYEVLRKKPIPWQKSLRWNSKSYRRNCNKLSRRSDKDP